MILVCGFEATCMTDLGLHYLKKEDCSIKYADTMT